jgi:hypothetical protein
MVKGRGGLGFLDEPAFTLWVGNLLRREYLQRDEAVEMGVAGLVHHPHAAFA